MEEFFVTKASVLDTPAEKLAAIRTVVDALAAELKIPSESALAAVTAREKVMSTGVGQGVAIPHAKLKGLKKFALSISRSSGNIDYGALDGQPVQILALLLSPEEQTKEHVRMIADITKRLKFSHVRQGILDAKNASDIEKAFLKA
jgi:mannitol/fructose-specific phosphotransferase system IIA component (Ntr-type)